MLGKAALLALAFLAAAPSAHAATVTAGVQLPECDDGGCGGPQVDLMSFAAEPGEVNDMRVSVTAGQVIFRDLSAPLTAGRGCTGLSDGSVACPIAPNRRLGVEVVVEAALGDQPDRAAAEGIARRAVRVRLRGGPGDDTLSPGPATRGAFRLEGDEGRDSLRGSARGETLVGGAGVDVLAAGGGDDELLGDEDFSGPDAPRETVPSDDLLDGGPGRDKVQYTDSGRRVRVDLADPGPDGREGEADTLTAIEDVAVAGPAEVLGDGGPNRLIAFAPGVLADGRDGDDTLVAATTPIGGRGDDVFRSIPSSRLRCGPGIDSFEVAFRARLARVPRNCERAFLPEWLDIPLSTLRVRDGRPRLRLYPVPPGLRADGINWSGGMRATVTVRERRGARAILARGSVRLRRPSGYARGTLLRLRPTARGRRRLGRRPLSVHVTVGLSSSHRLTFPTRTAPG